MATSSIRTTNLSQVTILRSSFEKEKEAKISEALGSINKLNFDAVGLVGREEECNTLKDCLDRITQPENSQRELVLLSGQSGTGKTALATTIKDPAKRIGGAFVSGKYDFAFQDSQPYSGIAFACNELCKVIFRNKAWREQVGKELLENIDKPQLELLQTIVPALADLLHEKTSNKVENVTMETEADLGNSEKALPNRGSFERRRVSLFPRRKSTVENIQTRRKSSNAIMDTEADPGNSEMTLLNQGNFERRRVFLFSRRKSAMKNSTRPFEPDALSVASGSKYEYRKGVAVQRNSIVVLELSFRRLLRALCSKLKATIMLVDDLQWADASSLGLIKSILEDEEISNLMLIGCFRLDEVGPNHMLSKTLQSLREEPSSRERCKISEIVLHNLSLKAAQGYIVELLSVSDFESAEGLASICHKRTLGNAFFLRVFLATLHAMGLLEINIGTFKWKWDAAKIEQETAATDNVISLLRLKMNTFSEGMLLLIQIASCLGNVFKKSTLDTVWESFSDKKITGSKKTDISELINLALDEMLFEVVGECLYRFVHDKIQEAAASLVPRGEWQTFQHNIGRCLLDNLSLDEDTTLFVVVDLLNSGAKSMDPEMAMLYLKAAERSIELSAFATAARYIECGISNMSGLEMWGEHFGLSLQLFSTGAEAEFCNGDHQKSIWYCEQVRTQPRASPWDKVRVFKVLIETRPTSNMGETWDIVLEIFDQIGFVYPRSRVLQRLKAAAYLQSTKKYYLTQKEEVDKLPFITDFSIRETIALLVKAGSIALVAKEKAMYILVWCHCIRLTKKYGLTEYTAPAFASFANVIMHENGDWETAVKVADVAWAIQNRLNSNYTKTSTFHRTNTFVYGWIRPLRGLMGAYTETYKSGMLSGNIEAAMISCMYRFVCQFCSSSPLARVKEDIQIYLPQFKRLSQNWIIPYTVLLLQTVMNLTGDSLNPHPTKLIGSAITATELNDIRNLPNGQLLFVKFYLCFLCAIFGVYDEGAQLAMEMGDSFYRKWSGTACWGFEPFPRGLCLYAHARETKMKKFLVEARKVRSNLRQWVEKGAINLAHQLFILDAEDAAIKGKEAKTKALYTKAIKASARGGFLNDRALASERYGMFLLEIGQPSDGMYHINESIRFYGEWGANQKVLLLREKHGLA